MANFFQVESLDAKKPTLALYGQESLLIKHLIQNFKRDFNLYYISNSPIKEYKEQEITTINPDKLSGNVISSLDYLTIFLSKQEDKKTILPLIDLSEKHQAKTLIVINIRNLKDYTDLIIHLKKRSKTYFVLIGDLFTGNAEQNSVISNLVSGAIKTKSILLTGDDLVSVFPISVEDAEAGINHLLFSSEQKGKVYYLFYKHPQTIISAVHLLKRVEPDLEIKFGKGKKTFSQSPNLKEADEIIKFKLLEEPYSIEHYLHGFENSVKRIIDGTDNFIPKIAKKEKKQNFHPNLKNKFINFILFLLFVFMSYLILNLGVLAFSIFSFKQSVNSLQRNDFSSFTKYSTASHISLSVFDLPMETFSQNFLPETLFEKYSLFKKGVEISYIASKDYLMLNQNFEKNTLPDFQMLIPDINYMYFEIEKIRLENKDQQKTIDKVFPKSYSGFITLVQVLPEIFSNSNKNYLMLFQNNAELRPTGGFIGSVAQINLSNNKISNFQIRDVYELDGQLKAHVEPHYIVRRYLQPHLYLRDSNFSLNFEDSASTSALLYNLETKEKVDGVIAVDFEILKKYIETFGPIKLYDYNITLDSSNLFDFIESTIKKGNFAGSQEKKNILSSIFDQILINAKENPSIILKSFSLLPELFKEKYILFAFRDNSIQAPFNIYNLSDSYSDQRIKNNNTFYDLFSVNEANITSNKANLTLKRSIDYNIYLSSKETTSSAILNIINDDKNSLDYFAYIRFVAPHGSKVNSVKIDGVEKKTVPAITDYKVYEKKGFKPPKELELEDSVYDNNQIFGLTTKVPKGKNQKIEIDYSNASILPENLNNYDLLFIKQPGTDPYALKVNLFYKNNSGSIITKSFNQTINSDQEINLNLK